jgi:N-acetylneuraminate lyase
MTVVAAGAPQLPFYYYHIPRFTGAGLDMTKFLRLAASRIPNLAGLKYSDPAVYGYQACVELDAGRFDILWGVDEMLLSSLVVGCHGAVGSTYNVMAPVYRELIDAFTHGNIALCRDLQAKSVQFVRTVSAYPFHPGMREILRWQGVDCGVCRLPIHPITQDQVAALRKDLERIEFF